MLVVVKPFHLCESEIFKKLVLFIYMYDYADLNYFPRSPSHNSWVAYSKSVLNSLIVRSNVIHYSSSQDQFGMINFIVALSPDNLVK